MLYLLGFGQVIGCFMALYSVRYMRQNRLEIDRQIAEYWLQLRELDNKIKAGEPREQYKAVRWLVNRNHPEAHKISEMVAPFIVDNGRTITASFDDAFGGRLENKTVVLMGFYDAGRIVSWADYWYPGTKIEFVGYGELSQYLEGIVESNKKRV